MNVFILILAIFFIVELTKGIVVIPSFKRHYGQKIDWGTIKRLQPTSVYTCAEYCLRVSKCSRFNFYMESQLCELNAYKDIIPEPDTSSTFYVNAAEIPAYFAGICQNHNCTKRQMCYPDEEKGPVCLPLNINCTEPKAFDNANVKVYGYLLDNKANYSCANGSVLGPIECLNKPCKGPVVYWNGMYSTETNCVVNGHPYWSAVDIFCKACFTDPQLVKPIVSTTLTGKVCSQWTDSPLKANLSNEFLATASNLCRSPVTGTDYDRPYLWCFTDGQEITYDICSVPRCSLDVTVSANRSIFGDFSYQHQFADVPITRLLCNTYTNMIEPIPHCPISRFEFKTWTAPSVSCSADDCLTDDVEYRGKMTCTVSGRTCQNWNSQTPHTHNYTLSNIDDQYSNFCRNPDERFGYPWCFTTDPEVRYEYCWVPHC